jgi:cysteinyl-tRNA synthetase
MIKLYNTLTRRKVHFRPLAEGKVGIYTCGPTLHDLAHIGLIRRLLAVDILKKVLQRDGYQVRHIVNLTDIDDKTIDESARRGQRLDELTDHYAAEFYNDMATLRMFPADHYPRATEHVDDMVEMTRQLAEVGTAYEMRRSVYFDISSFPGYGKLSRVDPSKIRSGATVDLDYYEKDNPCDFTLMRRSDLAELRRRITYKTDWGNVRPGWHIECAAMAAKYLGLPFDIHTSGQDLVFPHNENENAICESLAGEPMARYWMHVGLMLRRSKKMSRSSGTALTLRDLLGRGYTGSQIRYFLLQIHYRRQFDFSFARLDAARKELGRFNALIKKLRRVSGGDGFHKAVDEMVGDAYRGFFAAMHDDLNVPKARACLFELLKRLNKHMDSCPFSKGDAQLALDFLWRADRILCVLDFGQEMVMGDDINLLIEERNEARAAGDFERADALRQELKVHGVALDDTPSGSRVRPRK